MVADQVFLWHLPVIHWCSWQLLVNQKASMRRDNASNLEDPAIPLPASPSKRNTSSSSKCHLSNPSLSKPKKKKKTGKEKGAKDSIKHMSMVSFYMVYTNVIIIAALPSITIDDNAINKQLGLSMENTGTAAAATESWDKPNAPPNLPIPTVPLPPEHIDIDSIDVNPSYSSLKGKLCSNFCLIHV